MNIIIGIFIGTIIGFFTASLISGRQYSKGFSDGYRECQQDDTFH